jgi:hypothetical protein
VSQHSGAVSQHSGLCLNTVAPRLDRTALPARPQHCSSGSASSEFGDYATMGSRSRSAGEACVSTQWRRASTQWPRISTQWRRASTGSPYPRGYNDTPTAALRPSSATTRPWGAARAQQERGLCLNTVAPRFDRLALALPARQHCDRLGANYVPCRCAGLTLLRY